MPWFEGPDFLFKSESEWPCDQKDIPLSTVSSCMLKVEVKPETRYIILMMINYYFDFDLLIRACCYLINFVLANTKQIGRSKF